MLLKKLPIYLLVGLMIISAALALSVQISSVSVNPGALATSTIRVNNSGGATIASLSLSSFNVTDVAGNKVTFVPSSSTITNLTAGSYTTRTISGTVPVAFRAGTYTCNMNYNTGSTSGTATYSLTVTSSPDIALTPLSNDVTLNEDYTVILTISNPGNVALDNMVISSNAASKYNVSFNPSTISSLGVGSSTTVTLKYKIPQTDNFGTNQNIFDISVLSTQKTKTFDYVVNIDNKLDINYLQAWIDDSKVESHLEDENDDYLIDDPAKPGEKVEFKLKLKNAYSSSDDIDIDNVKAKIVIEEIDDGDDLDDSVDFGDIKTTKYSDEEVFTFTVPEEAEEQEYDVVLTIEGEIDNNDFSFEKRYRLEVEKDENDLRIARYDISPSTFSCGKDSTATVNIKLTNYGSEEMDEVSYTLVDTDSGINIQEGGSPSTNFEWIELTNDLTEDDSSFSKAHSVRIPSTLAAGSYKIILKTFYDEGDSFGPMAYIPYTVTCGAIATPTPSTTPNSDNEDDEETNDDSTDASEPGRGSDTANTNSGNNNAGNVNTANNVPVNFTTKTSASSDDLVFYGLIGAVVLLALVVIYLIYVVLIR